MNKDQDIELSPTALNPVVGIEIEDNQLYSSDRAQSLEEE